MADEGPWNDFATPEKPQEQEAGPWSDYGATGEDAYTGAGLLRAPRDVAELGARGINAVAQGVSTLLPESLQATPRQPQPYSWQKSVDEPALSPAAIGHGVVEEAKKLAKPVVSAATLPGDVYAGRVDPLSDEGIGRAADLAGLTMSGTLQGRTAGGTGRAIAEVAEGPSNPALKASAKAVYESPAIKEVRIAAAAGKSMVQETKNNLGIAGIDDLGARRTFAMLNKLEEDPEKYLMTVDGLRSVRRIFNNIAKDSLMPDKGTERTAALSALTHVSEFLSNLPTKDIIQGNPAHAAVLLKQANADYAAAMRSAMLDARLVKAQLRAKAANSGMNIGNTIRQRMADILLNPKLRLGFSPEELAQMQTLVEGTTAGNIVRGAGNVMGGGGGGGTALWELGAAISDHSLLAGVPVAGYALRRMSNAATVNRAKAISAAVRKRSPLGQGTRIEPSAMKRGGFASGGGFDPSAPGDPATLMPEAAPSDPVTHDVMVHGYLAGSGDHYVDDTGNNLQGAPDANGMMAEPVFADGTSAIQPANFSLGPPYSASQADYNGTPMNPGAALDFSASNSAPANWQQFEGRDTSTGGGYWTMDQLYASRGQPVPWAFQQNSNSPSTNNYRLLAPMYQKPNFIMRNGHVIDLNSSTMSGPGKTDNSYGGFHWNSGAAAGFPSAYAIGHSNSIFGWPGMLDSWANSGSFDPLAKRGGMVRPRGGLVR